jgi:4-hydroxybenzoate polyprenyltransferase
VLRELARVVRAQDWWFYKIPPLLAAGYATALVFPSAPGHAMAALAAAIFAICMVATFGYVVNDLFDLEQDARSGRRNTMVRMRRGARAALCVIPVALAFGALRFVAASPAVFALLSVNLLLPALYSIPPIRLKERGLLGVLADAGAAHAVPTALMVVALTPHEQVSTSRWWAFLAATCGWALCSGLRGIIVHQVRDQVADAAAGIETFGGRLGPVRARAQTFAVIVPLEGVALLAFLWCVVPFAPVVGLVTLAYGAFEIVKMRAGWHLPLFEPAAAGEPYIPLLNNEFYELWLPLGLALQLGLGRLVFLWLFAFQIAAFYPNIRVRGGVLRRLVFPPKAVGSLQQ